MKNPVFVPNANAIQSELYRFLKPLGFRKKGRAFNWLASDGLVHVIDLQTGRYEFGVDVLPGLNRGSFYGLFTINLGVVIPAVCEIEDKASLGRRDFYQEYHSQIRARLASLAFGKDHWWNLALAPKQCSPEIVHLLETHGIPFLNKFQNYNDIGAYYATTGELPFCNSGRAAFVIGLIKFNQNDLVESRRYFLEAIGHARDHRGFREYVTESAAKLGIEIAATSG